MRTWWLPLAMALAACSAPREPLTNTAANGSSVRIAPTDPLGWLGIATARPGTDNATLAPENADVPLVTTAERAALPATVNAIGSSGAPVAFTTGPATKIAYGCDGNQLDVTPFLGPRLPAGIAWILPPTRPVSWSPAPVAITSRSSSATQRTYVIGPLTLELARTGDLRGTLTVRRDGKTVHTAPFERHLMEGADPAPIDLAQGGPGIPDPVAAWSIAPTGPFLVVLAHPGYEGTTLRPLLVEDTSARAIEAMEMYLYSCAF